MAYSPPYPDPDARSLAPRGRPQTPSLISGAGSGSATHGPSQLVEYWHVLRDNYLWVCSLALLGLAIGWVVAKVQQPMYQARTELDIRSLNENFLNPRDGASTGTTESVLPQSYVETEIKILQSESIRKRALDKIPIPAEVPGQKTESSFWENPLEWLKPAPIPMKDLVADAGRRIKVRAVGNTRIVDMFCDARDGQIAALVCNTVARTYIENNLESRSASTRETSDWLQSQLDDVRRRLTKAENDLNDAGKANYFGPAEAGENPGQDKLRQLQAALSRSEEERISKESNYSIAARQNPESLPSEMDSGPIREYRLRLADLRRQLSEALRTMTPEHYRVRELQMQVADSERALQKERDDLVNRLKSDLETSLRRESMLATAYDKQAALVSQRDDVAVRYNMIKRDVDSERQLYGTLLQKVGEVGLAAAMRTSTITVVDLGSAPLKPYSPNILANAGGGLLGGAVLGIALSLFRFRSDRSLRYPGEASMHLQLRELGVIPSVRSRRFRLLRTRDQVELPPSIAPQEWAALPLGADETERVETTRMPVRSIALATWLRVPELSDAFFGTMTSLLLAGKGTEGGRVIVITSPGVGDGKTTVATNLAIALAQIGRRVVLVDGDLRKPRLHSIFDEDPENGLAAILEDDSHINTPVAKQTQISNLWIIPTKPILEGVSKKIHSSRMRGLLEQLRKEFDVVLIDSPPVLRISDARVFGWLADGVVLVFRARKTSRDAALAVYDCLVQDGVRVLGTILNDWKPRRSERYAAYSSYFRVA